MSAAELAILIVVMSAVTYRVTRFITADTLIEEPRDRFVEWAEGQSGWRYKLAQLAVCPYCASIWVSAGCVLLTRLAIGTMPLPVWMWLTVAAGALVLRNAAGDDDD